MWLCSAMFYDTFVHKSGLGRAQGTKNETFALQTHNRSRNPNTKPLPYSAMFHALKAHDAKVLAV